MNMAKRVVHNIKLGAFVLGGLIFLVLMLYMIGKKQDLFGNTYILKARFENIHGLVPGNNIRFSGIHAGTVKRVKILNDTVIEVTMLIETKMKSIIRKNAVVSIGTDGLVGNKVVNIGPSKQPAPLAEEGDFLSIKKALDTDVMLETLNKTNNDVAVIAAELKLTIQHFNNSSSLWEILNDKTIPKDLRIAVANLRTATGKAGNLVDNFNTVISDVKNGKGSVGALLTDTSFAVNLNDAVMKIKNVGDEADKLAAEISKVVSGIDQDINKGKGVANALLKDSMITIKLNASLDNIQKGTDGFNQNMEALKHNIFFRGYFKKSGKKKTESQ
jgi:phospholipid/cholesterol/gamma-HCH transport system substrate-binding protein